MRQILDLPTISKKKKKNTSKMSQMERECILFNAVEAKLLTTYLSQVDKIYIPTDPSHGDCLFASVLTGLKTPTDAKQGMYTPYHLRLQVCMHMITNYEKMLNIEPLVLFLIAEGTSLYHCILKSMEANFWADATLLHVIHDMWGVNLSMLNVWQKGDISYNYGTHTSLSGSDIVLIYNGHNHFTGTGKKCFAFLLFLLHACLLFIFLLCFAHPHDFHP